MTLDRRQLLALSTAAVAGSALAVGPPAGTTPQRRTSRIGLSPYSFGRPNRLGFRDIEKYLDLAADMGFDGVEILHRQMPDDSNAALQRIKRRAFVHGLALMGFSTHQGFLSPKKAVRQKNVEMTIRQIEVAYA